MSVTTPKALPRADGDFYQIIPTISEEDQALLRRTRAFLEAEVAPVITEYWIREEFPHQLIPRLAELHIMGLSYNGYGCPGKSTVLDGMMMMGGGCGRRGHNQMFLPYALIPSRNDLSGESVAVPATLGNALDCLFVLEEILNCLLI